MQPNYCPQANRSLTESTQGGVSAVESIETAMKEFHFIQMARPLITNPNPVNNLKADPVNYRNPCTHRNCCAALINDPSGVGCVELHPESPTA